MGKAVLISINPKWCEKIANGEKTIEIRKTRPNAILPLKCYIYCTKPKFEYEDYIVLDNGSAFFGGGKVIGEFIPRSLSVFRSVSCVSGRSRQGNTRRRLPNLWRGA